jgi:hypothetical protein
MNSDIDKKVLMILLSGGHSVTEAFYKKVELQVEEIIPALTPEASYTLEILCRDEFWQQLSSVERRLAGRCMANMVSKEELPLVFVGCPHSLPKKYRLK